MKFSKIFTHYKDDENVDIVNYICIDDVFHFLRTNGENIKKGNLKRSLQTFHGGSKVIQSKECVSVLSVLKYFFSYANS